MKTMASYSFQDPNTDRQTDQQSDEIDFGMYSKRPFEWYDTHTETEN